jgi:TPR repeat protein
MFTSIEEINDKYKFSVIKDNVNVPDVLTLFNTGTIHVTNEKLSASQLHTYGLYYCYVTKDYIKTQLFLKMAVDLGYPNAMVSLGSYHYKITKDYDEMIKYYLMAINLGHTKAMYNLGIYHYKITKDYDEMIKYYLMAVDLGHVNVMFNLGIYHENITEDYDEMIKYYLMAINLGHTNAMYNLGHYHSHITKDYDEMIKYYLMAIDLGHTSAMFNLGIYYQNITKDYDEMIKYYLMAIDLGESDAQKKLEQKYGGKKTFEILDTHYESKILHTDDFLKIYTKEFNKYSVKILPNDVKDWNQYKHIYEKYVVNCEPCTNLYAPNFTIIGIDSDNNKKNYCIHAIVLNSEYFSILIDGEFTQQNDVTINVSSFKILDVLIKYLYLFIVDYQNLSIENVEELLKLADEYEFKSLITKCKYQIKEMLFRNI